MDKLNVAMVALAILTAIVPSFAVVVRRSADARGTTNWPLAIFTALLQVVPVLIALLFAVGVAFGLVVNDHPLKALMELSTSIAVSVTKAVAGEPLRDIEAWMLVQTAAIIGTLAWFLVRDRYRPAPLINDDDR